MKNLFFILFLVILNVGCSNSQEYKTLEKEAIIIAFGDSLTYGKGASSNETYPAVLGRLSGYNIINEGVNGDTAKNGVNRIKTVANKYNPDFVIVSLGGNDMLRRDSLKLESNLIKIIEYLKGKGILVAILAEPKPSLIGISDAEVYSEVSKKTNTLLIKNTFSKYFNNESLKSDRIHLNGKGYSLVAEDIYQVLLENGIFK